MVGCGKISEFHVQALRSAGLVISAIAGRPGSIRAKDFAMRLGIPRVFADPRELIEDRGASDALVLAPTIEATLPLLRLALGQGRPVLVEKPVSLRSRELEPFLDTDFPVMVGYNRRFYRTVQVAAQEVAFSPDPVLALLALPEAISAASGLGYLRPFFSNSVHGLDLARYVFGPLAVVSMSRLRHSEGPVQGIAATLRSDRGHIVQFVGNWSTPSNFSLSIERPGRRFELRPFESATIYEGMEVVDPSPERPIRSYHPRVSATVDLDEVDWTHKPGFVAQAREFAALARGVVCPTAARLRDAHAALALAEQLVGSEWEGSVS